MAEITLIATEEVLRIYTDRNQGGEIVTTETAAIVYRDEDGKELAQGPVTIRVIDTPTVILTRFNK